MTSSSWMSWPETFSSHHPDPVAPAGTSSGALWLWPTSAGQGQWHGQNPQMSKETFLFCFEKQRDIPAVLPAVGTNWLHVWRIGYRSWPRAHDPVQENRSLHITYMNYFYLTVLQNQKVIKMFFNPCLFSNDQLAKAQTMFLWFPVFQPSSHLICFILKNYYQNLKKV